MTSCHKAAPDGAMPLGGFLLSLTAGEGIWLKTAPQPGKKIRAWYYRTPRHMEV